MDQLDEWWPQLIPGHYPAVSVLGDHDDDSTALTAKLGPNDVQIEFADYHAHFDFDKYKEHGAEDAILFVDGLMREHLMVCSLWASQKCVLCWVADARNQNPV